MPMEWRAVSADGQRPWRLKPRLAEQDGADLIAEGLAGVEVVFRIATHPMRSESSTWAARQLVADVVREASAAKAAEIRRLETRLSDGE